MRFRVVIGSALALAVACIAPPAISAGEGDYIGLFGGFWSGSGVVLNDAKPWQVNCQIIGRPGVNHLNITGSCQVFVVSVAITADITYDPKSGRYGGTYTGGEMAATISGKRNGDTVDFAMIWAKPINGETRARLTIVNAGKGDLRIVVDNVRTNAPDERASDLLLTQR
jgi:hypothetical protein